MTSNTCVEYMFIGTLRSRLFISVDHEWNGIVRDITAQYEQSEHVDPVAVEIALAKFYRDRATLANFRALMNEEGFDHTPASAYPSRYLAPKGHCQTFAHGGLENPHERTEFCEEWEPKWTPQTARMQKGGTVGT